MSLSKLFYGRHRWEEADAFLKALPPGSEVQGIGCWVDRKTRKKVVYLECEIPRYPNRPKPED